MASCSGGRAADGDWLCPDSKCGNLNFARRTHCNKCGKEQVKSADSKKLLGTEIGKAAAEKSHGLFSAEDWQCNKCGNVNWARRGTCNMCNAPKIGELEERTGYGGGFNERQNVEYVPREASDDEFDDFGRRKKKHKANTNSSLSNSSGSRFSPSKGRKSPDVQPSNKNDYSEEEEEEDDDDGDLSKYALWSDDEDLAVNNDDKNKKENQSNGKKKSCSSSRSGSRSLSPRRYSPSRSRSSDRKRQDSRSRSPHSRSRHSRSRSSNGARSQRSRRDRRYSSSRSRSRSPRRRYSRK